MNKKLKVCLVGSSGGHLTHLYMLKPFWENKDRFWVTFDKEDARSLLGEEVFYPLYFPSNRSLKALVINTWRALKIIPKERPDLIITSGAAGAVPFFMLGNCLVQRLFILKYLIELMLQLFQENYVIPLLTNLLWNGMKC